MAIREVFPNPTVKKVVFQIRFPSLFYIENKIGDFQISILDEFPHSTLNYRKHFILADLSPGKKVENISDSSEQFGSTKIWEFKTDKDVILNVSSDSLSISSAHHKTYDLGDGDKFKDFIEFALSKFFEVTNIPLITRMGLRYIDECPIMELNNSFIESYYNTSFPLARFDISNASEMDFKTVVTRGDYYLRYLESLKKKGDDYILIMDFDGYAQNINPANYITILDDLHKIINDEWERSIKEPLLKHMRTPLEEVKND